MVQPYVPNGASSIGGCPATVLETILSVHFLQQWLGLYDSEMEAQIYDKLLQCEFAIPDQRTTRLHYEFAIVSVRY